MIKHEQNGWFVRNQLISAASELQVTSHNEPTRWLTHGGLECKYVHLRVDMRTGDFIFLDNEGCRMTDEQIYNMFPRLASDEEKATR